MEVYGNEIDFLTMKTLQENEGYDVPWEFVRRRAARSPTGTTTKAPSIDGASATTTKTGVGYRSSNNENDILRQAAHFDKMAIGSRTNGRFSIGGDPSVNGCKKDNASDCRNATKPPVVAPKPIINSNGSCLPVTNGDDVNAMTVSSTSSKMPGDSAATVISNTPPCGIRAQRIRKERYGSGGCTPVGSVSASPLSRGAEPAQTAEEMTNCVVWEYRKPEHDARPSCEYDTPWDCKRLSSGRETPSCSCSTSGAIDGARQSTNGDAIYDEPWDINKNGDPVKAALGGLMLRSTKHDSSDIGNNSPSSTSRSSESRGSAGNVSSSNGSDRSELRRSTGQVIHEQYPDVVSVKGNVSIPSRQDIRGAMTKNVNGASRAPVRLETAFCAKPTTSSMPVSNAKKRFQDKDKLIQQLCSGDVVIPPVRQSIARRSTNARYSAEMQSVDRRKSDDWQFDQAGVVTTDKNVDVAENRRKDPGVVGDVQIPTPDYDTPWEFFSSPEMAMEVNDKQNAQHGQQIAPPLPQLQQTANGKKPESKFKLNRQHLSLNFGCAALNPNSTKIDTSLPLNEQAWYHGNITRAEAEQRLAKTPEGSFLVRVCESSTRQGEEYALSLKSAKGFMHMKIQQDSQRNWILGYFSQPFESVPIMIRYYSFNKLPIKGAEHMRLLRPVADQVL